jgi:hypothetical protein
MSGKFSTGITLSFRFKTLSSATMDFCQLKFQDGESSDRDFLRVEIKDGRLIFVLGKWCLLPLQGSFTPYSPDCGVVIRSSRIKYYSNIFWNQYGKPEVE